MAYLYSIFHLNLSFSLIDEEEVSDVINNCYWPLLKILEKNRKLKIAIELSGNTLIKLNDLDRQFIKKIKTFVKSGQVEILASGYEQIISPILPYQITLKNLSEGQKICKEILGVSPKIAYINELTFSDGLVDIYKEAGFDAIVVDWDNLPEKSKDSTVPYQPVWLKSQTGTKIKGLFISSVAMKKFRNLIFGEITYGQYLNYLKKTIDGQKFDYFPIYGDDLEIYDFKPGSINVDLPNRETNDFKVIQKIFLRLCRIGRFILPGEILKNESLSREINLTDVELTIRTKKQEKYNVSRWTLCGRNNSRVNSLCLKVDKNLDSIQSLLRTDKRGVDRTRLKSLSQISKKMWSSDFRTHTTENKWINFQKDLGWALRESEEMLKLLVERKKLDKNDFVLVNTTESDWDEEVFETKVCFDMGKMFGKVDIEIEGEKIETQQEETVYYRDGSLQKARLVFKPKVQKGKSTGGNFRISRNKPDERFKKVNQIKTSDVWVKLWTQKGSTIESLIFPKVDKKPLCGVLLQGFYNSGKLSADWFSGHSIITLKDDSKLTDLENLEVFAPVDTEYFPIRIPIIGKMAVGGGEILKKYYVYQQEPRIDIEKQFMFYSLEPKTFRNLNITILPDSFSGKLNIMTVNGGKVSEKFLVNNSRVIQDELVNTKVSSHGCQGTTDGWFAFGDETKGLAVISDLSESYSLPLFHFEEEGGKFFARVCMSVAENDDTAAHFFRGKFSFRNTVYGFQDLDEVINKSFEINHPLIFYR